MLFELNLILTSVSLGLIVTLSVLICWGYLKHKTVIEKYAVFFQVCLTAGLVLFLINLLFPVLFIYQIILLVDGITFVVTIFGFYSLLEWSGEVRPKKEKYLMASYLFISIAVVLIIAYLNIIPQELEGRTYYGIDFELVIILMFSIFIGPLIFLGSITIRKLLRVYEKRLQFLLIGYLLTMIYFLVTTYFVVFFVEFEIRLIMYGLLITALVMGIILNRVYPEALIQLGFTFAFKNVFIIHHAGQTIYSHEFERMTIESIDKTMIRYLIGGFLYAISHGIKEIIKQEPEMLEHEMQLRSMDFGRIKMIFYMGKIVFGVLFSQEVNNLLYEKLKKFIDEFEVLNHDWLDKLPGSAFEMKEDEPFTKKTDDLLKEYFKY